MVTLNELKKLRYEVENTWNNLVSGNRDRLIEALDRAIELEEHLQSQCPTYPFYNIST